jgi:sec-independent protein translocase protein TatB
MPFLSPAKLLIILVIALLVLGPEKLPKVAKQIGSLWQDFRQFREKIESEVRGSLPDLPSSDTIAQAVRSPLSFFENLADSQGGLDETSPGVDGADPLGRQADGLEPSLGPPRSTGMAETRQGSTSSVSGALIEDPGGVAHQVPSYRAVLQEDPGMN